MAANNIIISINTKMTIKMFATNNRIIIKESFAKRFLKSGSSGIACPAHPKNKVSKWKKDWLFSFEEGGEEFWKDEGVDLQCTVHDQCSTN